MSTPEQNVDKHWTDVLSMSELEEQAKQFWVDKRMGGAEPTLADMYIAGFRLCFITLRPNIADLEADRNRLREMIKDGVPHDCAAGYDEVKFCSFRNGQGNMCMKCLNF
jgi:hypothetical protein